MSNLALIFLLPPVKEKNNMLQGRSDFDPTFKKRSSLSIQISDLMALSSNDHPSEIFLGARFVTPEILMTRTIAVRVTGLCRQNLNVSSPRTDRGADCLNYLKRQT